MSDDVSDRVHLDEYALETGYALQAWSSVEEATLRVFEAISGMASLQHARVAFLAIRSFETKLDVCHALMGIVETDEDNKLIWDKLYARIRKHYKKRHQLAHFSIVEIGRWHRTKGKSRSLTLRPFWPGPSDCEGLSVKQVRERRESFAELRLALDWFFIRHAKILERSEGASHQEPDLISQIRLSVLRNAEEQQP